MLKRLVARGMLAALVGGCAKAPAPVAAPSAPPVPALDLPQPKIPIEGTQFRPSLLRLAAGETYDKEVFEDHQDCGGCHTAVAAELKQSAHAFASLSNPTYLMSFTRFADARGEKNTRFCAGCHDPALLLAGASFRDPPVAQRSAHMGVACSSCHGAVAATGAGNASHTLTTSPIPLPIPGNAGTLDAHRARVAAPTLRSEKLCASCHRGALNPEMGHEIVLSGLDEWGGWRRSAYAGNQTERIDEDGVVQQTCIGCHMPKVDGHASHRFAGGHSMLAHMLKSPKQEAAVRKMVQGAASVDLFPLAKIPGPQPTSGLTALGFDVVIFNERVGHNFPGGAKDMRDTWVEVRLADARGTEVAASGVAHAQTGREPLTYVLHSRVTDKDGRSEREHDVSHFRTPVYDHTIAARDAAVIRYALELPVAFDKTRLPLRVTVRLRHRRISLESQKAACEMFRSDKGQTVAKGARKHRGAAPDPCGDQPIIDVAEVGGVLGGLEKKPTGETAWRRQYRYGLGLLQSVQEGLSEAEVAFQSALDAVPPDALPRIRAMIIQGLATVAARQGRLADALALFAKVEQLLPKHPSTAFGMGEAQFAVWRFGDAAQSFERAVGLKEDDRSLRRWAMSLGSMGKAREALAAAQQGLGLEGRDALLLRSQLLAYRALGAGPKFEAPAAEALRVYERDSEAPHVRDRCFRNDPLCQLERTPAAVRWLAQRLPNE